MLGVEMCESAVDDARHNASLNGLAAPRYSVLCATVHDLERKTDLRVREPVVRLL